MHQYETSIEIVNKAEMCENYVSLQNQEVR